MQQRILGTCCGYILSVWGSFLFGVNLLSVFVKANRSQMEGNGLNPEQQLQTHINTLRGHSYDSVYISMHICTYMVTVGVYTGGIVLVERSGLTVQIERGL